jgi:sugar/nucleoside kinase (ribokinase family)
MRFDILGIGHTAFDTFCVVGEMPIPDTECWLDAVENQGGGAAAQAVVTASRLGMRAAFAGSVGDDSAGRFLVRDFRREKVDTGCLAVQRGKETSKAFIVTESSSGRRTLFVYAGTLSEFRLNDRTRRAIKKSRCVHLDATTFGVAEESADFSRACGVMVSLDGCEIQADHDLTARLVSKVDILITNESYPMALTGLKDDDEALLALAKMGPRIVISTKGSKGCRIVEGGSIKAYPAYKVRVVDTTGAGDVFHGAFLTAHLRGWGMDDSIKFASACSAINCMTLGGRKGIPSLKEVQGFIAAHDFS